MNHALKPVGFVGLAMVVCALAVTVLSPQAIGPLPHGLVTPVLAFELAANVHEVETMFGATGSPERAAWVSAMRAGTLADFGLITMYGLLLAGVARQLLPALDAARPSHDHSSTAHWRARLAVTLAVSAALLDVLENRELLSILDALARGVRDYDGALASLAWLTWPKWLALGAWFVALSPELVRAGSALRFAAMVGSAGALTGILAVMHRGVIAEVMALCIAIGMVALVPGCLRKLPAPASGS